MEHQTDNRASAAPDGVRRIESEDDARALAHRLLTPGLRSWPVVVLTIAGGHDEPFGDPEEIKEAVGDLAEVVLMPTSDVSWAFSEAMPPGTQVYGGAGRVYPVQHEWASAPERSRLRFAYSPADRRRVTDLLINDALQAAVAAGLVGASTRRPNVQQRSGVVQGVIGSRALVTLDDGTLATVWEELTVPGVPLEQVLTRGQRVTGAYDPVSRRLDVRDALRFLDPTSAARVVADTYRAGDVVLADVVSVTDDVVGLRLMPGLTVDVPRELVTSNPQDTLGGLFTVGEVVACRVDSVDPVRLRLDDVDDEETPRSPPSLLPDGPPWLRLPDPPPPPPPPAPVPAPATAPADVRAPAAPPVDVTPRPPHRRPTPLDLAARARLALNGSALTGRPTGVPAQARGPSAEELRNELAAERATRTGLAEELRQLRERAAQLEEELLAAGQRIRRLQTRYREADRARQQAVKRLKALQSQIEQARDEEAPAFLDPEEQFRYEVYREWVRRIPAAEKADKPLAEYTLGDEFLSSLDELEGISRDKVVAVVVEVLTGQVQHLAGREPHQLRAGPAGSRYVTREDGATCWRVALQRDTAAARRLHYWRTRDGYELSRVVLHDDYRP